MRQIEKGKQFIQKAVTPKTLSLFLAVMYIVSLIPIMWISWYNYPSADDYSIGRDARKMWDASHSVLKVIGVGIWRAIEDWQHWMGYFTSNFLMAVPPNAFGERCYVVTAWIMVIALTAANLYLLRTIFVKVFGADKWVSNCVIFLMLFVTVQRMVGRVEAFFWYSGAVNYMFIHCLSLFFYGLLISAVHDKGRKRIGKVILASFLGFLTGGGNQMTALNVAIVLFVVVAAVTFKKKWNRHKVLLIPIIFFYIGFILNVAAPGNWIRAENTTGMNPVKAVLVSFLYCLEYCIGEWSGWPVLLLVLVLIPLFWHMTGGMEFCFSCPLVVVVFGYCLVSAMMTPPLFAMGNIEAHRLQAVTFTMYILVLTLCVGYLTGWARKQYEAHGFEKEEKRHFSMNEIYCLLCCIGFFGFAGALMVIPNRHYFTFTSAITDLADGSAQEYGEILYGRIAVYRSGKKNVEVEALTAKPYLLYFSDIQDSMDFWENQGLCKYYELDSAVVK